MTGPFAKDLKGRFEATLELGRRAYPTALKDWPGDDAFRSGYQTIRTLIPSERLAAATSGDVYSYGAWNPSVLFVGLSPGMGGSDLTREEEHVIGAPGFFRRYPFPQRLQELTCVAFGHAVDLSEAEFGWYRPWILERTDDFLLTAGSAFSVLNLSSERRPKGNDPVIPPALAAKRLERHLDAFQPRVVVAVKNKVSDLLRKAYPEARLPAPRPNATTALFQSDAVFGDHHVTFVGMPVHPDASYPDQLARYAASGDDVSKQIAHGLTRWHR